MEGYYKRKKSGYCCGFFLNFGYYMMENKPADYNCASLFYISELRLKSLPSDINAILHFFSKLTNPLLPYTIPSLTVMRIENRYKCQY